MRLRIVASVFDPPVWILPSSEVARLAARLPEADVIEARQAEERRREFPSADVIITTKLTAEEARLARRLQWIHSTAVGVGPVLVPEVVNSPVIVTNARGLHAEYIAEHAMALVLAVRRSLHTAVRRQFGRDWAQAEIENVPCPPASESRLLVIGLGEIGARVARMAAGFGFTVAGLRRRPELPSVEGVSSVAGIEHLHAELPLADVVVLTTPTTAATRAMIGAAELALMKPHAVLVNVARGRLVDEEALVDALSAGRIGGAGLDAFVREPLPADHALWSLPNVLMSPHTAAFGRPYWPPTMDLFVENLSRFVRGEPLRNVVDKIHGY